MFEPWVTQCKTVATNYKLFSESLTIVLFVEKQNLVVCCKSELTEGFLLFFSALGLRVIEKTKKKKKKHFWKTEKLRAATSAAFGREKLKKKKRHVLKTEMRAATSAAFGGEE